jgi:hypothetical protein
MLDKLDFTHPGKDAESWEKVVRKVRAGMMPPGGAPRPDRATMDTFAATLEAELDRAAAASPNPGFTGLHRLNRTEYANAIRDLLALDIDAATLLPADDSSEGFDNIADALGVSPALVERYASAATKVSRMAVGNILMNAFTTTYRVPGDLSQTGHIDGLPLGTRGGILVHHNFPLDAEYDIKVRARSGGIGVGGIGVSGEELEVMLNGERLKVGSGTTVDVHVKVKAGPQTVGAAYLRRSPPGADDVWQIYAASNVVQSVAITGPLNATGLGDTPARRRIFVCRPASENDEEACAKNIVSKLAQRAYRQPPSALDIETLLGFYRDGRKNGGFDAGIEQAVSRVLADPRFVFRFEREPANVPAGRAYRISDTELASRLSFFLWSSIPDDELIGLAAQNKLHEPAVLERDVKRMLADAKAESLVYNFAGQWLGLRELQTQVPVTAEFPDFDDNLRAAMAKEMELFVGSIIHEDRPITDLIDANYTFVNERLAKHYDIPNVYGSAFRRITLGPEFDMRRGLLGKGYLETISSKPSGTSAVQRGKTVLQVFLGTEPPPPPPNVPQLQIIATDVHGGVRPTIRQQMEMHRSVEPCASCHKIMDPIGFSLENFDAVGHWRTTDDGAPINTAGVLVDGSKLDGVGGLRAALLRYSPQFERVATEKLLIYALGRGTEYFDMPLIRSIVRDAQRNNNRFSSLVLGVVKSEPFQMNGKLQISGKTGDDAKPAQQRAAVEPVATKKKAL